MMYSKQLKLSFDYSTQIYASFSLVLLITQQFAEFDFAACAWLYDWPAEWENQHTEVTISQSGPPPYNSPRSKSPLSLPPIDQCDQRLGLFPRPVWRS